MALERKDRVQDTTTTTGTGTLSLGASADTGYRTFVSALTDGATVRYLIQTDDKSEWEIGEGIFTDATPDTLTRVTIYASSNAGAKVNFSAGTKKVYCNLTAQDIDDLNNGGWDKHTNIIPTRASSDDPTFELTFAGVDLTDKLSEGMKIKFTQTAGDNAKSLDLEEGSSQYASIADGSHTGLDITGDLTIEACINLEQLPSSAGTSFDIVSKYDYGANQRAYRLVIDNADNKIKLQVASAGTGGAGNAVTISSRALRSSDVGKFIHIVATVDVSGDTGSIYLNGTLDPETAVDGTMGATIFNSSAPFAIGCLFNSASAANFFDGLISEVRVWNDIRTEAEIKGNMAKNLVGDEANLQGYWKLDNDYLDETSNNNDLTASGSPVFSTDVPPKLTNSTKFGFLSADVAFSTDSTVTLYLGTDFAISDNAISDVYFSHMKAPYGFPIDPDKWTVETVGISASRSNPDTSWANTGSFQIDIPIGKWRVSYEAVFYATDNNSRDYLKVLFSLSTSTSAEGESVFTTALQSRATYSNSYGLVIEACISASDILKIATKGTYYLINKSGYSMTSGSIVIASTGELNIRAVSAYL